MEDHGDVPCDCRICSDHDDAVNEARLWSIAHCEDVATGSQGHAVGAAPTDAAPRYTVFLGERTPGEPCLTRLVIAPGGNDLRVDRVDILGHVRDEAHRAVNCACWRCR